MAEFVAAPYNYVLSDLIVVRVSASNSEGFSAVSASNVAGATVKTVPTQMAAPTKGASSSETQLEVDWVALSLTSETGDSPILSYHLQWDSGSSGVTFTDLVGYPSNSLVLTYLISSGVSSGNTYQFKVRAKNLYGWGAYSTVLSLKASSVPDQPAAVTTSKDALNVRITWVAPADNSEAITAYQILIVNSVGG